MTKSIKNYTALFLLLISPSLLSSCEEKKANPELGKPSFSWINEEDIKTLVLEKSFPGETPFSIKLIKHPEEPLEKQWTLTETQEDTLADSTFIRHLLSTLKTLSPIESPENDKPEQFGLKPPRATLLFTLSNHEPVRLNLGDEVRSGVRYGKVNKDASSQIFSGALIRMIELIRSKDSVREKKILLRPLDDFDLIRLTHLPSQKVILLEREGAHFKRNLKKMNKTQMSLNDHFIERLFHFKIKSFEIQNELKIAPFLYEIRLTDRKNKGTFLKITALHEKLFFKSSEREHFYFEAYPELLTELKEIFK